MSFSTFIQQRIHPKKRDRWGFSRGDLEDVRKSINEKECDELYMKKQLYSLQLKENANMLEHLNLFNMLIRQLSGFAVKMDDEDKVICLVASLPTSCDLLW